jgi:release factor glutamine methyltransferase
VSGAGLTRAEALRRVADRLRRAGVESAEREAEWLLLHALRIDRSAYWADPRAPLGADEAIALEEITAQRERRVPLQLILGAVPFHGVTLLVAPKVFVPRPETEELVEAVLASGLPTQGALLDWGTGTGAIAVALLAALPGWTGVGADREGRALFVAAVNAFRNGVGDRYWSVYADLTAPDPPTLFSPIDRGPFDVVVSNPPYVRRGDIPGLMTEVRDHDPREALDGGDDGLDAFRHLARGLDRWLRAGGLLALEIGADQADNVLGVFSGLIQDARVLPDRAGRPRFVIGTMRGGGV